MNTPNISFVEVDTNFDPSHLHGFVHLYQRAYNEHPPITSPTKKTMRSKNTVENVNQHVWEPHLHNSSIFLAIHDGTVIGLGCCMSEVCVLFDYRHKGIGSELVLNRIAWAKRQGRFSHYTPPTRKVCTSKLRAWQIPDLIQDVDILESGPPASDVFSWREKWNNHPPNNSLRCAPNTPLIFL